MAKPDIEKREKTPDKESKAEDAGKSEDHAEKIKAKARAKLERMHNFLKD